MPDNSAPSDAELQALFKQATYQHIEDHYDGQRKHGYIGVANFSTGLWELRPPTRTGNYVMVTLQANSPTAPIEAICAGVIPKAGTPVVVVQTKTGWIVEADHEALQSFSPSVNLGVAKHTHRLGFGNEDPVEGLRFEPLLCHALDGLYVRVEPGFYRYNDTDVWWAGGNINLTSNVPATSNTWAWVKIGIDPTTNALVAKTGTEYPKVYPISPSELAPIAFTSNDTLVIRSAGIKLRNGQTSIADYRDFYDLRPFASGMNAPIAAIDDSALFLGFTGLH